MKIVKLVAENVKRLHAVEITPDGSLVTIGGKNGAGKSSVLDSIAYAMGGEKLVPSEPIRAGESEAKIVVDLGDLVVTRRFKRERMPCDCIGPNDSLREWSEGHQIEHDADCASRKFSDATSSLIVTNKDGARYPSPQAVLDKLLGRLTFDPLAFAREGETPDGRKRQAETLRRLVGLDFASVDARRKEAVDERAMIKKSAMIKNAQLNALPHHDGVPTDVISLDGVSQEMLKAEELRKLADDADREVAKQREVIESNVSKRHRISETIAETQKRIAQLQETLDHLDSEQATIDTRIDDLDRSLNAAQITAQAARAVVPDVSVIRNKLAEIEATNVKVRANQRFAEASKDVSALHASLQEVEQAIKQSDDAKRSALASAAFPVAGLGLSDDGVTFNDLPFEQAGSSEQVRVSVAIGIALNPMLRVC